MSPEWNDPHAVWHEGENAPSPNDLHWDDAFDELPPLNNVQNAAVATPGPSVTQQQEVPAHELGESFSPRFEVLWQLGQQLSPILVPLLFAGLTFLCILPFILNGQAYLSTTHAWPIPLALISLAVLQGIILHNAGSNNVFWVFGIAGGFCLFLLTGCFTIFGPTSTLIVLVALLIIAIVLTRRYMRTVPEGTVDLVHSFGKYTRTLFPGLNFLLPWEQIDCRLNTREIQWTCPEQTVPISLEDVVHLKATISYQLMPEDAYLAAMQVNMWEDSLHELFLATLQTVVHTLSPENFIGWSQRASEPEDGESHWGLINTILFQRTRDRVALWGVQINWVHIRDVLFTHRIPTTQTAQPMFASRSPLKATRQDTAASHAHLPQAQENPIGMEADVTQMKPLQEAPLSSPGPSPAKLPKEDVLIKAYKEVQKGNITAPETIRGIAARFQQIASDPQASQTVSFDAALAAQRLYELADQRAHDEARKCEEQATFSSDMSNETLPDWQNRQPNDDNLMAGG